MSSCGDKVALIKNLKMKREFGLGQPETVADVAHAQFTTPLE